METFPKDFFKIVESQIISRGERKVRVMGGGAEAGDGV